MSLVYVATMALLKVGFYSSRKNKGPDLDVCWEDIVSSMSDEAASLGPTELLDLPKIGATIAGATRISAAMPCSDTCPFRAASLIKICDSSYLQQVL